MKIQDGKLIEEDLSTLYNYTATDFLSSFDRLSYIKDGGILDGIVAMMADTEIDIQSLIGFIAEQANPERAGGIWQDILYERLGVVREAPERISFQVDMFGTPNAEIGANTVLIQDENSNQEFRNEVAFNFDGQGHAKVVFSSLVYGYASIEVNPLFKIISAPYSVTELDNTTIILVREGKNRESDEAFRARFRASKAMNSKASRLANFANLNKYIDNMNYLNIYDKTSNTVFPSGEVEIIVKHNTTDTDFAKAVFDTFGAGIVFRGDTSVVLKDEAMNDVTVRFHNADVIPVYIKVAVIINNNFDEADVCKNIKSKVLEYAKIKAFGLESTVYATSFAVPVLNVPGVDAVTDIKIKRDLADGYSNIISFNYDEIPEFSEANIYIEGESQ